MTQTAIPYLFMRGGTSRGPYFNRADLPEDLDDLARVLVAVVGSGHPLNIDGIGGGMVTTKVAMLSKSATTGPMSIISLPKCLSRMDWLISNPPAATSCQVLARRRLNWALSCASGRNRNQNLRGEHGRADCHTRSNGWHCPNL